MKELLISIMLISAFACKNDVKATGKPNVIIILSDDVGIGDISCYGAKLISTPNIDKLAKEGMQFMNAYANGSVCTPTRYSILTGEYPIRYFDRIKRIGLNMNDPLLVDNNKMTLASLFNQRGYETAAIGKWHLGYGTESPCDWNKKLKPGPLELGFDYHFGIPVNHNDAIRTYVENYELVGRIPNKNFIHMSNIEKVQGLEKERLDDEVNSLLKSKALNFIRENKGNPFFLYFTPTIAHTHVTPQRKFRGMSLAGQYGDYLVELDHYVGEIMALLQELDIEKNTIVVFASDNGGQLVDFKKSSSSTSNFDSGAGEGLNLASEVGNVRFKAKTAKKDASDRGHLINSIYRGSKGSSYEGGFRVPLVIRWPGTTPINSISKEIINTADFMATFAEIIGTELPDNVGGDSFSFLYALENIQGNNSRFEKRKSSILVSAEGRISFRIDDWKLIRYSDGDSNLLYKDELYNLVKDPQEKINRAKNQAERVKSMNKILQDILESGRHKK